MSIMAETKEDEGALRAPLSPGPPDICQGCQGLAPALPPPPGEGLVYFLASIYDRSLILGCLPVGRGSLFELLPLNGGHIGFFNKKHTFSQ